MRRQSKRGSTGDAVLRPLDGAACVIGAWCEIAGNLATGRHEREPRLVYWQFVRRSPLSLLFAARRSPPPFAQRMSSLTILTALADGVLTITLNRPEVLNSFNEPMADALVSALRSAADDEA